MPQSNSLRVHNAWVIRVPDLQLVEAQARDSAKDVAHALELLQMAHTPPSSPKPSPTRANKPPSQPQPAAPRTSKSLAQTIAEEWSRESKESKERWRMADAKLRDKFPPSWSTIQRSRKAKM